MTDFSEWDFKLFDCLKSPGMLIFLLCIPFGSDCMQAVNAKASDPENKNACVIGCLCPLFCCCIGSVFNRYRLAQKLRIKDNLLINIIGACCCTCCAVTQEWMQTIKTVKGNHELFIWDYCQEEKNKNRA